jgi:hypothetical protein
MAYIESYQCDVCGDKKGEGGDWWLAWVDCFQGEKPEEDQPLIKLTRWQSKHAHSAGVRSAVCGHADRPLDDAAACRSRRALRDELSTSPQGRRRGCGLAWLIWPWWPRSFWRAGCE